MKFWTSKEKAAACLEMGNPRSNGGSPQPLRCMRDTA